MTDDPRTQMKTPSKDQPIVAPPPLEDPRESTPKDPGPKLPIKDNPIAAGG